VRAEIEKPKVLSIHEEFAQAHKAELAREKFGPKNANPIERSAHEIVSNFKRAYGFEEYHEEL